MNEKKKLRRLPQRILSFVLTLAMMLTLMPGMNMEVMAAAASDGYTTDGHGLMEYCLNYDDTYREDTYDVKGYVNEAWRQVTYNYHGFKAGVYNGSGLNITTGTPSFIADGHAIEFTYTVTNTTSKPVSNYRFYVGADTCIDGNDANKNEIKDDVVIMTNEKTGVSFFALSTTQGGTAVVTEFRNTSVPVNYKSVVNSGADPSKVTPVKKPNDSAFLIYFPEVTIEAHGTKEYTLIVGMGTADSIYDIISRIIHTCGNGVIQAGKAATCTEDGFKDYYKCGGCDKLYKEAACANEITNLATWKTGEGKRNKLGHDWRYTADEATLTATCKRDASHTATLTLSASDANYSGSEAYTGATLENLDAFKTATKLAETPRISYYKVETEGATTGGTAVDASTLRKTPGYYYAAVTVSEKTAVKAFKINKNNLVATNFTYAAPENLTYNGTAKTATVTAKPDVTGIGSITVEYYDKDNNKVASPTNAGTYTVKVTVTAGDNYNAITTPLEVGTFTISKKKVALTWTAPEDLNYDGTAKVPAAALDTGVTVNGTKEVLAFDTAITEGKDNVNVGTFTYTASGFKAVAGNPGNPDNYLISNLVSPDYTIKPFQTTLSDISKKFNYTGTGHKISFTPSNPSEADDKLGLDDFEVKYYKVDEDYETIVSDEPLSKITSIGKYIYVIKIKDGHPNYTLGTGEGDYFEYSGTPSWKDTEEGYVNVGAVYVGLDIPVFQKPISFEESLFEKYYSADASENTFEVKLNNANDGAKTTYTSSNENVAVVEKTDSGCKVVIKGIGNAKITATSSLESSPDVYDSFTVKVSKEPVKVTVGNRKTVYGSESGYGINDLTFSKSFTEEEIAAFGSPQFTGYEKGDIIGKYRIEADGLESDYYDFTYQAGILTVSPKELKLDNFTVVAEDKTYDGTKDATVTAEATSGLVGTDKLTVAVKGSFDKADAGHRTVNYVITGISGTDAGNYKLADVTGSVNADITKANIAVAAKDGTVHKYDGTKKEITPGASVENVELKVDYYTVDENDKIGAKTEEPVKVGKYLYVINLVNSTNYEIVNGIDTVAGGTDISEVVNKSVPNTGIMTIAKNVQPELKFDEFVITKTYGDPNFTVKPVGGIAGAELDYEVMGEGSSVVSIDEDNSIKIVKPGGATVKVTAHKDGYEDASAQFIVIVEKKNLDVTLGSSVEYNGTIQNAPYNLSDGVELPASDMNFTYWQQNQSGIQKDAEFKNAGQYFVTVSIKGSNEYYTSNDGAHGPVAITKRTVTVSGIKANNKVYDGTTAATLDCSEAVFENSIAGDKLSVTAAGSFEDKNVGKDKTVTITDIILGGDSVANYELAADGNQTSTTADITAKAINVKADNKMSIQFNELVPLTYTSDELCDGDEFTGELATDADRNEVGVYEITQGTLKLSNNYSINFTPGEYEVKMADPASLFIAKASAGKNSISYSWNAVPGAAKYKVYFTKCGKSSKFKCIKTTTSTSLTKKSLKSKTAYKMYVVALNSNGKTIATTPTIHVITKVGKYSNATKVTAAASAEIKIGETVAVNAKIVSKDGNKAVVGPNHTGPTVRYYSSNNNIATVDNNGVVTGKATGAVNIYSVAADGVHAITKVVVNKAVKA